MTYKEIIDRNANDPDIKIRWWARYAFHYTDITNALGILTSGFLYSRKNANSMGLMKCDNASRQVIEMTRNETTSFVRFYFRPKTPTQYYNEGYKHPSLRYDGDPKANVPVPVFFLFDLEKLLGFPETQFSETPQSGSGSPLHNTPEEFAAFDFKKIYSDGRMSGDEKRYRHAEILFPNSFDISKCPVHILCRNNIEKTTLLNLLKNEDITAFHKYKERIKVPSRDVFMNNGLYVTDCAYHKDKVSLTFSDTYEKHSYISYQANKLGIEQESLKPVEARAEFDWMGSAKKVSLYHDEVSLELNYCLPNMIVFTNLENIKDSKQLRIKVYIEDMLVCFSEHSLAESEML